MIRNDTQIFDNDTKIIMEEYICHSGGAKGADTAWDELGRPYGVKSIHYRPKDYQEASEKVKESINESVTKAAQVLRRPTNFKGIDLVRRNWFQVYNAEAVFAVANIISPNQSDDRGFVNSTGKEIVSGGTGWAVEMAIQVHKPVWVYDMITDGWYVWIEVTSGFTGKPWGLFNGPHTPIIPKNFAGIGSRNLTEKGRQAIQDVYEKTFSS